MVPQEGVMNVAIRSIHPLSTSFVRNITTPGQYRDGARLLLLVIAAGTNQWVQRLAIRG